MADSIKRTWRIIRDYLYEKTFGKMLFMMFSRTFMMFGIGLITVPALFLFFHEALQAGDVLKVCGGAAAFGVYVVWIIWGDKNRMLKYNRLFFLSEIRIHKSYVEKLVHIPYDEWRKGYDAGSAANLIEDGTDEVMFRFQDVFSLAFKGAAVLMINLWILVISSIYVTALVNAAIIAEFGLSSYLSGRVGTYEKKLFDAESAYRNLQRIFTDCTEDYAMAGLGDYWKKELLGNMDMKYGIRKKMSNLNGLLQSGMDFIDLSMYLVIFLYGLAVRENLLSPLVIIMAYEMIKDVTGDFIRSAEKIRKKVFAVEAFEKIDRLAAEAEGMREDYDGIPLRGADAGAESNRTAKGFGSFSLRDTDMETEANRTAKGFGGICLRDVDVAADGKTLLSGINLTVEPGTKVLIVGDNGSGKTVLLKTILGIYEPAKGDVRYDDIRYSGRSPGKLCSKAENKFMTVSGFMAVSRFMAVSESMAYDPVERMLFPATIAENANMYAKDNGYGADELGGRLQALLGGEYDVEEEIADAKSRFSLGQIDTLCMLRIEKSDARVFVLDEPLCHADKTIFRLIWRELLESDRTVIAVEHEFDDVAKEYNPTIVWMEGGSIKAIGTYGKLMERNEAFRKWRKRM